MPPSNRVPGFDDREIEAYVALGDDDPALEQWKQEHPDWFLAGERTLSRASPPRRGRARQFNGGRASRLAPPATASLAPGASGLDPSSLSVGDFTSVVAEARSRPVAQLAAPVPSTLEATTPMPPPLEGEKPADMLKPGSQNASESGGKPGQDQ